MKTKYFRYCFMLTLLSCCGALAQSGRPPGYNNNIDEQMAEMQIRVRYGGFLENLSVSDSRRVEIASAKAHVFMERNTASRNISAGIATAATMEEITSPNYLRQQLLDVLTNDELLAFDQFEDNYLQIQLRDNFNAQLSTGDAVDESQRQLRALMQARSEIITQLDQEQMQETEKFLNRIQSGLLTSQSMNDGAN